MLYGRQHYVLTVRQQKGKWGIASAKYTADEITKVNCRESANLVFTCSLMSWAGSGTIFWWIVASRWKAFLSSVCFRHHHTMHRIPLCLARSLSWFCLHKDSYFFILLITKHYRIKVEDLFMVTFWQRQRYFEICHRSLTRGHRTLAVSSFSRIEFQEMKISLIALMIIQLSCVCTVTVNDGNNVQPHGTELYSHSGSVGTKSSRRDNESTRRSRNF